MRVPPNPLTRAVDVAAHGPELARRIAALVPRAAALLDAADRLVVRLEVVLDRFEQSDLQLQAVIRRVAASELAARTVIEATADLQRRATIAFDDYEPALRDARETVVHAAERFGPAQVDALITGLAYVPLLRRIDEDVLPVMSTLQTIAPDLTELLAVSRGLNELMGSIPGMGRAKRRVDEDLANDGDESG